MDSQAKPVHDVVIVGGGFAGIAAAVALRKAGLDDFVILEKADQLGGTWRDNTYPGCACDVPSQLYSFSFAPNPDWSRVFAEAPEIQRYLVSVAHRFSLSDHVRHGTEVHEASFCSDAQRWTVHTNRGTFLARALVAGFGPLHHPKLPDVPGIDDFEGPMFHSARWNHDVDLRGKRVAVIGTGSSAVQLIPKIQPHVAELLVFQRTPSWVLPKPDHRIPAIEKAAFRYLPGFRRAYRGAIYGALELLQLAQRSPETMRKLETVAHWHLKRQVEDPALRQMLTPSFRLGCKRLLLSNTYYPALCQPNTKVVPTGVTSFGTSYLESQGKRFDADVVIFGTGFYATDSPVAGRVRGRDGRTLAEHWNGSPEAYLGTTVHGFPNFFYLLGPNLGNGHTSALVLLEAQAGYMVDAIKTMKRRGLATVEIKSDVQQSYNESVQRALAPTVWNAGGCASWYIDENGRNSSIYPWTTIDLRRRLRRFDVDRYDVEPASLESPFGVEPRDSEIERSPQPTKRRARIQPIELPGAVVAITGGARGIGRAIANAMHEAGAIVCIGDLDSDAAQAAAAALGPTARGDALDVTQRSSFEAWIDGIEREVGPTLILVNNAGIMPAGAFLQESDEVEARCFDVNYRGTATGMRVCLPRMVARGHGHVINVVSMAGRIPVPGLGAYVASKHAALGLSDVVRSELEGTGVTLSAVLPGAVRTRLSRGIPLDGILAVEPEAVARAAMSTLRRRPARVVVPPLLSVYNTVDAMVPASWMRAIHRALGADRVLTRAEPTVRASYERDFREPNGSIEASPATSPAPSNGTAVERAGRAPDNASVSP